MRNYKICHVHTYLPSRMPFQLDRALPDLCKKHTYFDPLPKIWYFDVGFSVFHSFYLLAGLTANLSQHSAYLGLTWIPKIIHWQGSVEEYEFSKLNNCKIAKEMKYCIWILCKSYFYQSIYMKLIDVSIIALLYDSARYIKFIDIQ